MIKKGATVENFPIYDDLTFIKKEETTLVLLLELSGKIISKNIQSRAISDKNMMLDSIVSSLAQSGGSREYKEIDCKIVPQNFQIVLNIIEPLTEQKLWAKRVEINESAARDCKYKVKIDNRNKTLEFFSDERLKIIAALLEQVYPEIMKKIDAYLDPVELKSIQEKALKLKKLKRF